MPNAFARDVCGLAGADDAGLEAVTEVSQNRPEPSDLPVVTFGYGTPRVITNPAVSFSGRSTYTRLVRREAWPTRAEFARLDAAFAELTKRDDPKTPPFQSDEWDARFARMDAAIGDFNRIRRQDEE